jgi:hypothetical protein
MAELCEERQQTTLKLGERILVTESVFSLVEISQTFTWYRSSGPVTSLKFFVFFGALNCEPAGCRSHLVAVRRNALKTMHNWLACGRSKSDQCADRGRRRTTRLKMKNFTIENETNNIIIHGSAKEAEAFPNSERFGNEAALAKLAAEWPAARLVEIWNSLPGEARVRKFKDRATAIWRIWKAIQNLGELPPATEEPTPIPGTVPPTDLPETALFPTMKPARELSRKPSLRGLRNPLSLRTLRHERLTSRR